VSSKKCPYWQSEGTLGKSHSRALCHSPVDLPDFVFTNAHISCLRKENRKVLRQDRERISFYNLLAESPTDRRLCFILRIISAWSTVCWEKKNRLISPLWLVVGRPCQQANKHVEVVSSLFYIVISICAIIHLLLSNRSKSAIHKKIELLRLTRKQHPKI
jgi:hypothetical protein